MQKDACKGGGMMAPFLAKSIAGGVVTANTYDRENRLTETDTIGVSAGIFAFGGDFHRKKEREIELYYLDDLIIGEGQGGALSKVYLQLGGQLVGEVLDVGNSAQARYYLSDFLGSVTGQTNPDNDLEFERRMSPYGLIRIGEFTDGAPNWVGAHGYRYSNHLFAQMYVWHRVYALETSQWTTRDMLWPEEGAYGYVKGNPVTWVDPSGLIPPNCWACAGCLGASALWLLHSCMGAPNLGECMLCRIKSNPWVQGLLIACASACVVCVGGAVSALLPKPIPVRPPGLGPIGARGMARSNHPLAPQQNTFILSGSGTSSTRQQAPDPSELKRTYHTKGTRAGDFTDPCKQPSCATMYEACKEKQCPGDGDWWVTYCEDCLRRCLSQGHWPTTPRCDFWNWS